MDTDRVHWGKIVWQVMIGVAALWLGVSFLVIWSSGNWEQRGQIGDMFGAANSLFSGFAFAGVVLAIYLQRQDLAMQREELRLTREELKRSAEAQESSEEVFKRQAASLKTTARLNAAVALLGQYNQALDMLEIVRMHDLIVGDSPEELLRKKKEILADIEEIYEGKADH